MGSKSTRDCDSPSASSFLLPQLRHSRRGSLSSLSSANQYDKEALSQALDQIHNTASQTETLTTFNEYTSPPASSSGPDTKGIASELQGGLSGLYSRFRASVGNVKDIVNLGPEDVATENLSVKSPRAAAHSPEPLSKNVFDSALGPNPSVGATQATSSPDSEQQSPLGDTEGEHHETKQSLKPSTKSLRSASTSAKSMTGSVVALKSPPITLTQTAQPTTSTPALADVNVSVVNRISASTDTVSAARTISPTEPQRLLRNSRRPSYLTESSTQGGVEVSAPRHPEGPASRNSSQSGFKQQGDGPLSGDSNSAIRSPDRPGVVGSQAASTDSVRPFPDLEAGPDKAAMGSPSDTNNTRMSRPAMVVTDHGRAQEDSFGVYDSKNTGGAAVDDAAKPRGGPQHITLPLPKTMAPPLITRSHSSNLSLSRASSSDAESLNGSPLPTRSPKRPPPIRSHEALSIQSHHSQLIASTANVRDSRTMNVFSQVKNKVLNKEYWMKDENARDCFYCGDSFSTFRRKHHCRKSCSSCTLDLQITWAQGHVVKYSMLSAPLFYPENTSDKPGCCECANPARVSSKAMTTPPTYRMMAVFQSVV